MNGIPFYIETDYVRLVTTQQQAPALTERQSWQAHESSTLAKVIVSLNAPETLQTRQARDAPFRRTDPSSTSVPAKHPPAALKKECSGSGVPWKNSIHATISRDRTGKASDVDAHRLQIALGSSRASRFGRADGPRGSAFQTLDAKKIYACKTCKTHLADYDEIISRNFRGKLGKAYLFNSVINVLAREATERDMTTGRHVMRDIECSRCHTAVGTKYERAYEATERYKEGKCTLEIELLCVGS